MNRIRILLFLCCFAAVSTVWAATVSERQARATASRFMASHAMPSANLTTVHKAPLKATTTTISDQAAYYVFNANAGHGYVIVAGDDRAPAVLGYSDTGTFDAQDVPAAMQEWLDGYAAQIEAIAR